MPSFYTLKFVRKVVPMVEEPLLGQVYTLSPRVLNFILVLQVPSHTTATGTQTAWTPFLCSTSLLTGSWGTTLVRLKWRRLCSGFSRCNNLILSQMYTYPPPQGVDAPVAPGHKGMRFFLSGISDEDFALHRSRLRSVTLADLKRVAEKYLLEPPVCGKALIGGANKNLEEMGWTVHQQ